MPFRRLFSLLPLLVPLGACRNAAEHRADADREVYRILDEVRERLASDEAYRIERAPDRLRERLLAREAGAPELPPLSLAEVLEIAAENSREFQDQRESLYLTALDLTLQRWDFSVQQIGALGAFLEKNRGTNAQVAGGDGSLALRRMFETGASVLGSIGFQVSKDIRNGDPWTLFTNLSFSVTQPLLRGFGRGVAREPLTQAERDVLYEARSYERFRRTFAFDVVSRYFRVLAQAETLKNEELNQDNLTRLRERNEAFAQAGQLSDIQVDQARQDELRAQNRVVDARRSLADRFDELKLFLGLPVEVALALDPAELARIEDLELSLGELGSEQAIALALHERLDYANAQGRVVDAERRIGVFANALRTGLDVTVEGATTSPADRPSAFRANDSNASVSLAVDLPFNRLPERNDYRARLIALDASRRAAERSRDEVGAQVRSAERALLAAAQSYDIQTGAVALADRRVDSATLNLEAGRASTRDLLEAQEAKRQAQNAAINARVDVLLAQLALLRDLELLHLGPDGLGVDTERLAQATAATEEEAAVAGNDELGEEVAP